MKDKSVFIFLTVNHNPMKMEKENKRKKVGVLTPNVAFLIAGLLFMAFGFNVGGRCCPCNG